MKVAFVILHYMTTEDTVDCVNSILQNISYKDYEIIIVNNGSANDSSMLLHQAYDNNIKVHIIDSNVNLGFAKGNNLGFIYAKKIMDIDFVIMINNDTIINQDNFIEIVIKKYKAHKFDILGPDIISLIDNSHQNPYGIVNYSLNERKLKKVIFKYNIFILFNYLNLDQMMKKTFKIMRKKRNETYSNNESYKYEQSNVRLHGSCLIFSPDYVKKYNGLYDKTFLYMEEDILYYISKKEGLKMIYSPSVKILHKEDSSTNTLFDNKVMKRRFIYKNIRKSAIEFLKIIKDDQIYKMNILD